MSDYLSRQSDEELAALHTRQLTTPLEAADGHAELSDAFHFSPALLTDSCSAFHARGNTPVRTAVMQGAQRTYGNHSVQRVVHHNTSEAGLETEAEDLGEQIKATSGAGHPLESAARSRMEGILQADLSGVRVHTGEEAARLARSVSAVAFTSGRDIFFREGAYAPETLEGQRLLAHEAAHTVQQAAGPVSGSPTGQGIALSEPSDRFEQAADRAADRAVLGAEPGSTEPLEVQAAPRVTVARKESWWDRAIGVAGDVNNVLGTGIASAQNAAGAALRGFQQSYAPGLHKANSPVASLMSKVPGAKSLANLAVEGTAAAKGLKIAGTAGGVLGTAQSGYNLYKSIKEYKKNKGADAGDIVQASADLGMSGAGFAGPLGGALSAGYGAGQLLDKGVGWIGEKISGKKQADKDYSLSGMLAESFMTPKRVASKAKIEAEAAVRDAQRRIKDEIRRKNLADPSKREEELRLIREELKAGKG